MHQLLTIFVLGCLISGIFAENSFCDHLLNQSSNNSKAVLQGLTSTGNSLYLLASDHFLIVPMSFLDTTTDQLRLYNPTSGRPIHSTPWYNISWMRLFENSQNQPHILQSFTLLITPTGRLYRYYQMTLTWYLIDNRTAKDAYNQTILPWRLTTITAQSGRGGWFMGYVGIGSSRRVMVTAIDIVVDEKDPIHVYVNYPGESYSTFDPIPPPLPYYFLETNHNRSVLNIRSSSTTEQSNLKSDLFFLPQAGLLTDSKLYLFSERLRRVYILPAEAFIESVSGKGKLEEIQLKSKPWKAFFRCKPGKVEDDEDSGESGPNQADYLEVGKDLLPTDAPGEGFKLIKRGIWILVGVVALVGVVTALSFYLFAYKSKSKNRPTRKRKSKKQKKKKSKTSSSKGTGTSSSSKSATKGKRRIASKAKQPKVKVMKTATTSADKRKHPKKKR